MKRLQVVVVVILAGLGVTPAGAVDGVRLLGQPKPTAFPITISAAGSYRLRSNIVVPDENTTAIVVAADDVTIDLNGFAITGPTVCSGGPPVTGCAPLGSGKGIDGTGQANLSVMNGTVRGMGSDGIVIIDGTIDRVKALSNGGTGINRTLAISYYNTLVSRSMANSNGFNGINNVGVVTDSSANFNAGTGIFANASVSNSGAIFNGGSGITGNILTAITNSSARSNGFKGITGNVVTNSVASNNTNIGIQGAAVRGCESTGNGSPQISAPGFLGQNLCGGFPCP